MGSDTDLPTKKEMLEFLEAEFEPDEHKYEQGGNLYVGIDPTIRRLNEFQKKFDVDWHFDIKQSTHTSENVPETKNGKPQYLATVTCSLTIGDYNCGLGTRDGEGAAINFDPDTAKKSAQAYALRKAGNQFGIALYLKSVEDRESMEQQMRDAGEVTALKSQLIDVAELNGVVFEDDPSKNLLMVAAHFKVLPADLKDVNVLRRLVEANCE